MTNESVIKMLENLVADYDNLLADIQGRILKSGDTLRVAREELKKKKDVEYTNLIKAFKELESALVEIANTSATDATNYLARWLNIREFHSVGLNTTVAKRLVADFVHEAQNPNV